jgi:long-chain fatty acid transport protein
MKTRRFVAVGAFVLIATWAAIAPEAHAAGLYVDDRGVRPLGRGGAFVAGADDLGAIWYNPAGIVDAPSSLLLDGSYVHYTDTFTRQAQTTSATGTTYITNYPTVSGTTPFLPIPTIAGSYRWGDNNQYAMAFGIYAPDAALLSYPTAIGENGTVGPAPQRYSLISLNGSILAVIGGWFSYKPIDQIRVGAGVQMLTGYFKTTVDFSACPPDHFTCAQEDPSWDALSQLNAGPIFAPSANAGATWVPDHMVRIGVSGQAPFVIDAPTTVNVRLPSTVEFDSASQQGTSAHLHLELPPILRAGVELRPLDNDDLRIEVAYVREFWSVEQSLDITPDNIKLYNITGFPSPFGVNTISLPRGMKDSNSFRLGVEDKVDIMTLKFLLRAGVNYETSAVPPSYVAPLTVDNNKVIASIGGSIIVDKHLRLDGVLSHTIQGDVYVNPRDAAVPLINPVKGNQVPLDYVNGGTYHANTWILGGGLEYRF